MCGIAGFIDGLGAGSEATLRAQALKMVVRLSHRGPDHGDAWADSRSGVGLGHRRLSIVDLSSAGHQPMISKSGRFVVVFNGEIYNFSDLRLELQEKGHEFWGTGDTEVLLAAIEEWGPERAAQSSIGMFAFALWDRSERELWLFRDRVGEKPLYYGWCGGAFVFASELKAILAHPRWSADIDRDAMALYLRHGYIPAPHSIYRNIKKLLPGHFTRIDTRALATHTSRAIPYWSARDLVEKCLTQIFEGSDEEAETEFESLLRDSVRRQMVTDVPHGAFLSGGIDSSTIVALMQLESSKPIRTFTIGFNEQAFNEATYAKEVAQHLGTAHTELYLTPGQVMEVIPKLPSLFDEPFADSSQIPTYLVSQLAQQNVTVALTGDGGDELLGGYNRYLLSERIWEMTSRVPYPARSVIARALKAVPVSAWDSFCQVGQIGMKVLPRILQTSINGDRIHRAAHLLSRRDQADLYYSCVSNFDDPSSLVMGAREPWTILKDRLAWPSIANFTQRMMYLDLLSYLPDDILVKVDRASMGVSLETRVPFLDHRLIEFCWRLPMKFKIRGAESKWLLRRVLEKRVPKRLIDRPKMGFGVPIDRWLRGPLRQWANDMLSESRLKREGYFNPGPIGKIWKEHSKGNRNWHPQLWSILMFQSWMEGQA